MSKSVEEKEINSRQKVYDFLVNFIENNGFASSIREICDGTDLKSTSSVYYILSILETMGKIHMERNKQRAIKIIGYEFVKVGK